MNCPTTFFALFISLTLAVSSVQDEIIKEDAESNKAVSTAGNPSIKNACAIGIWKSQDTSPNVKIPQSTWLQTPSIVQIKKGHYRALGRVIHVANLKNQLKTEQGLNFDPARASIDLTEQLEILADTLYVKGEVSFYGIKKIKVFAREIVAASGSTLGVFTPNWKQTFSRPVATETNGDGTKGEDGKHGPDGPKVEIICDVITGTFQVSSKGGDGHKGQDGGPGSDATDSRSVRADKVKSRCRSATYRYPPSWLANYCKRLSQRAEQGERGKDGGKGGNAGKPGNGGNAGGMTLRYRKQMGQTTLKTCGGTGAQPAQNGKGGKGGEGGQGGRGVKCDVGSLNMQGLGTMRYYCEGEYTERARNGDPGKNGAAGSTPTVKGNDGTASKELIQYGPLDAPSKKKFPAELLLIIRRQAVDLLLGDRDNQKGRDALRFIKDVATGRDDVKDIRKDAERKLAFLDVEGFDIFGKNSLFAPLIRWETFYKDIDDIKKAAGDYENAFNDIISSVNNKKDLKQMASKFSAMTTIQVRAQRCRLKAARNVDKSEKRMYVKAIKSHERRMIGILTTIMNLVPEAYSKTMNKLNTEQCLAVLQAITGFAGAVAGKDPFAFIGSAISIMDYEINKPCLKSLGTIRKNLKKWLTFGREYQSLEDSSDLNFDKVKVSSIPDVMKANLDISKEKLAADLDCLLGEASRPRDVAALKAEIESYFIVGGARIDMIGKVMELDNNIGTYNFDIPLLEKTEKGIIAAGKSKGGLLTTKLRQTFTDNLLSTYKQLERSFMIKLYELHKALGFRTLWNLNDLIGSFRRIASESALGVGRLNGAVELTRELRTLSGVIRKAQVCFSKLKYTTNVHKWRFDKDRNKKMFKEIQQDGYTRFGISEDEICPSCYNARLIKMYIELYGSEQQDTIPDKIHLKVRHLSGAHFLAGDKKIKNYRQPITDYRNLKFDQFPITNDKKCRKAKKQGKNSGYCIEKDDRRWEPMCSHSLNGPTDSGLMMGKEECTSPSGYYELVIPVDKNLDCSSTRMKDTNCKDLDLTKFTKMNVWVYYLYWSSKYPVGPDDPVCRVATIKRNQTEIVKQQIPDALEEDKE